MRTLIVGCGSIGLRHIDHLREIGVDSIEAADCEPAARERTEREKGVKVWPTYEQALKRRPEVVLICTPASSHPELTIQALEAGAHVFIEKPLALSSSGASSVLAKTRQDGQTVQVGYQMRYHPAVRKAKEILAAGQLGKILTAHVDFGLYLERWWPGRDYRKSYMCQSAISGGLLFDLSHEIDTIIWLLGGVSQVFAGGGRLSSLDIDGPDCVKIIFKMAQGAVVSLSLDCLQPLYTRGFTLIGEGSVLQWRCLDGRADKSLGELSVCLRGEEHYRLLALEPLGTAVYVQELRDFFESIRAGRPPSVNVEEAAEVIRVLEAIEESMRTGRSVPLPNQL